MVSSSLSQGCSTFLEEAGRYRVLSNDEVRDYAQSKDIEALIKHHMFIVAQVAFKYSNTTLVELDELIADGMHGLMKAAQRYDASRGPFHHFARFCITNEIKRCIDLKRRWNSRQANIRFCHTARAQKSLIHEPLVPGGRELFESVIEGSVALKQDHLPWAHEELKCLAEHIQQILFGVKNFFSPERFYIFAFHYGFVERAESVTQLAHRMGFKRPCSISCNAKRSFYPLGDIHRGGHKAFESELETLHLLEDVTETVVVFEGLEAA